MFDKKWRQKRRAKTIAYGTRARAEHLRVVHPNGVPDCACETSVWFFAKRKSVGCNCRTRCGSNPKYAFGICHHSGAVRPAVAERIAGKKLAAAAQFAVFEDSD